MNNLLVRSCMAVSDLWTRITAAALTGGVAEARITEEDIGVIREFFQELPDKVMTIGGRVILAVAFFFLGNRLIKLLRKLVKSSMRKANADTGVIQFVDSFLKFSFHVVLAFMIAGSLGVDAASIVALLGSAGVAIGLAVQGGLSNLVGGVMILMLKPFKVGDYIIDCDGHEGTVDKIQIFYTTLVTPDNKTVMLPNGQLSNNCLVNVTSSHMRRLDVPVSIAYSADLRRAKAVLQRVLDEDEKTLKDHDRLVVVDQLGDSGVNLIVRCWFLTDDYWPGKWRITEQCKLALDDNGIEIPFPQVDVHMRS